MLRRTVSGNVLKRRLFVGTALFLFFTSMLGSPFLTAETQTVPNPDHLIVARDTVSGTIDPAYMMSTATIERTMNVYETLIAFNREKTDSFVPRLAVSWSISPDGLNYTFVIRPNVKFHNGHILTTEDVEYTFKRGLVVSRGLSFLLYDPLLGLEDSQDENGNVIVTAQQLNATVTRTDTDVTFHLARPYPPFLQILSSPMAASVMCKDWCVQLGEWSGAWDNWTYYNKKPSIINQQDTAPPGPHVNAMCGTGPYMLDYYQRGVEYSLIRFDDYWGGWPLNGANGSLQRITVKKITDWTTMRDQFLAGQIDIVDVPSTVANEILDEPGVRCIYPLPTLECDALWFNFNISTSSPFLGVTGGLPAGTFNESGISPDFFSDINVRKGFAYAFNYTELIDEAFAGEAFQPATPIVAGVPFYNPYQEKYTLNLTRARECFESAWSGQLWLNGFGMTICYPTDAVYSVYQKWCAIVKKYVESLNPRFHINIQNVTFSQYKDFITDDCSMPMFAMGWLADFADPHNFAYGFMKGSNPASLSVYQRYRNATIEALVDQGIATTDPTERKRIYYELQRLYWEDCPSVPVCQPIKRRFERDWVQGWCYNPLLYGYDSFYTEWKEDEPPRSLVPGENVVDAVNSTGTLVSINTTSAGNVSITSHDISVVGTVDPGIIVHAIKCVTIDTTVPHENIIFPVEIRVYYTDQEIVSAYVDQSALGTFYWNGTDWILENDTGGVAPSDIEGYTGYVWARIWHLSEFTVMGQQTLIHAVAPRDVRPAKAVVGQNYTASLYVDVFNQGDYEENFNVTLCANTTRLETIANISLLSRNSAILSLVWNTSGFATGDYTLTAVTDPVPGEIATMDNNYTSTVVLHVGVPGDISGPTLGVYDGKCDMRDISYLITHFNPKPSSVNWNANADINNDAKVNMRDISIAIINFNQHE